MDTAKLIEEAQAMAVRTLDPPLPPEVELLLTDLAATLRESEERNKATTISLRCAEASLKASEEQNGAIRRGLDWERAEREKVAEFARKIGRERDALATANLAANKRIVELEHERDAARGQAQENAEHALDLARDRDAARAELARLTTPRPIAEAPRTNSTQIIALWIDGDVVESMDVVVWADMDDGEHPERKFWMNMAGDSVEHMTHYLPLPEVKP